MKLVVVDMPLGADHESATRRGAHVVQPACDGPGDADQPGRNTFSDGGTNVFVMASLHTPCRTSSGFDNAEPRPSLIAHKDPHRVPAIKIPLARKHYH